MFWQTLKLLKLFKAFKKLFSGIFVGMVAHSETWGPNGRPLEQIVQYEQFVQLNNFVQIDNCSNCHFLEGFVLGSGLFLLICLFWGFFWKFW